MKTVVSIFYSDDGKKIAKVYYNAAEDKFEVDYINENSIVKTETSDFLTLDRCESLAEDYVMAP
jgi:hypothetical protein